MPDEKGKDLADAEELPETPLHAHDEDREADVVGDAAPEVGEEGDVDDPQGPGNPVGADEEE